jgi:hypothetical protein
LAERKRRIPGAAVPGCKRNPAYFEHGTRSAGARHCLALWPRGRECEGDACVAPTKMRV